MSALGIAIGLRIAAEGKPDANGELVTSHPLLPESAEIIYGGIASLLILWAIYKFGGPAIKKGMAARTERIRYGSR